MNKLEKKFKEYLVNYKFYIEYNFDNVAHDLAEIAEKDYVNEIEYFKEIDSRCRLITTLLQENATLKKQLERIKYLDRDEVEKIISDYHYHLSDNYGNKITENVRDLSTAICNLAIPITKDKIDCYDKEGEIIKERTQDDK